MRFFLFVTWLFSFTQNHAQTVNINGTTRLDGVKVTLYSSKNKISQVISKTNGKYKMTNISIGRLYKLEFSKTNYVTKFVTFDFTAGSLKNIIDLQVSMEMDKTSLYASTKVFENPVAKFYIGKNNSVIHDVKYIKQQREKIELAKSTTPTIEKEKTEQPEAGTTIHKLQPPLKKENSNKINLVNENDSTNNIPDGPWKKVHEDPLNFIETGTMKNGKLHGPFKITATEGNLIKTGVYNNGIKQGPWIEYHPNGNIKSEGNYNNGARDGYWYIYNLNSVNTGYTKFENGRLIEIYDVALNGSTNEIFSIWRQKNGTNDDSELNGEIILKYKNGNTYLKAYFLNGKKTGQWVWFNEKGIVIKQNTYENDILITK